MLAKLKKPTGNRPTSSSRLVSFKSRMNLASKYKHDVILSLDTLKIQEVKEQTCDELVSVSSICDEFDRVYIRG